MWGRRYWRLPAGRPKGRRQDRLPHMPPGTIPKLRRHPAIPYVLPFAVFIGLLALQQVVAIPVWLRFVVSMAAIFAVSGPALRGGPSNPLLSVVVGIVVFVIWVAPDRLSATWHH